METDYREEMMDLSDTEGATSLGTRESVPPGVYTARFTSLDVTFTRNGYPQVVGQWSINDGPYANHTIREWIVFTAKSAPFIKLRVTALGLPIPPRGTTMEIAEWFAAKANGRLAVITVANREREDGRVFSEVVNIESAGKQDARLPLYDPDADSEDLPF